MILDQKTIFTMAKLLNTHRAHAEFRVSSGTLKFSLMNVENFAALKGETIVNTNEELSFQLKLLDLKKAVSKFKGDINIELTDNRVMFSNTKKKIGLMQYDEKNLWLDRTPPLDGTFTIQVTLEAFLDAVKDIEEYSESIRFKAIQGHLYAQSTITTSNNLESELCEVADDVEFISKYRSETLKKLIAEMKPTEVTDLTITTKTDFPLIINWKQNNAKYQYFIAPVVDND